MVFNAMFDNITVIAGQFYWWRKPEYLAKISHWTTLSHNVVSSTPDHDRGSNSKLLVVIGTDCTGSCNSNYHTNTTTTTPVCNLQCQHFIWFISKSSAVVDTILTFLFLFYYFICIDTQICFISKSFVTDINL